MHERSGLPDRDGLATLLTTLGAIGAGTVVVQFIAQHLPQPGLQRGQVLGLRPLALQQQALPIGLPGRQAQTLLGLALQRVLHSHNALQLRLQGMPLGLLLGKLVGLRSRGLLPL